MQNLTPSVEDRLVTTLLDLAQLFGARCTHGYSREIFLTQQELADLVGASRSVVSTVKLPPAEPEAYYLTTHFKSGLRGIFS